MFMPALAKNSAEDGLEIEGGLFPGVAPSGPGRLIPQVRAQHGVVLFLRPGLHFNFKSTPLIKIPNQDIFVHG